MKNTQLAKAYTLHTLSDYITIKTPVDMNKVCSALEYIQIHISLHKNRLSEL